MGLFGSETFESLRDLFKHNLEDTYDAAIRLGQALPKMKEKATSAKLKLLFDEFAEQTEVQKLRLEQVFEAFGDKPERETCPAMKGLIQEGEEMLSATGDVDAIDAALIMSAQRIAHYKIAAYGSARCQAAALGRENVPAILQKSLDEVGALDGKLADLATSVCNPKAAV
ncbi:MAG: DUF892 family protein [Planctomycetota bacterium]